MRLVRRGRARGGPIAAARAALRTVFAARALRCGEASRTQAARGPSRRRRGSAEHPGQRTAAGRAGRLAHRAPRRRPGPTRPVSSVQQPLLQLGEADPAGSSTRWGARRTPASHAGEPNPDGTRRNFPLGDGPSAGPRVVSPLDERPSTRPSLPRPSVPRGGPPRCCATAGRAGHRPARGAGGAAGLRQPQRCAWTSRGWSASTWTTPWPSTICDGWSSSPSDMTAERMVSRFGYPAELGSTSSYDPDFVIRGRGGRQGAGQPLQDGPARPRGAGVHGPPPLPRRGAATGSTGGRDRTRLPALRLDRHPLRPARGAGSSPAPSSCWSGSGAEVDYGRLYDHIREAIDTVHRDGLAEARGAGRPAALHGARPGAGPGAPQAPLRRQAAVPAHQLLWPTTPTR